MTNDPEHPPAGLDTSTASTARIYDFYLGGKNNFPVDRERGQEMIKLVPELPTIARANRAFLVRAVRFLAGKGIDQFIDLGTGIPTSPNVHEVARDINPGTRVVYVDHDPAVRIYNRAILKTDGVASIEGDIREPERVLANPELRELIDFTRPAAVLFVAVFHFIEDKYKPAAIVKKFTEQLTAGSYVALSTAISDDNDPAIIRGAEEIYANVTAPAVLRTRAQAGALLAGLDLILPGLVPLADWRPDSRSRAQKEQLGAGWFCAAAARKP